MRRDFLVCRCCFEKAGREGRTMWNPPSGATADALRDYLAFYRGSCSEGTLVVCNDAAVKAKARRLLPGQRWSKFDVPSLAESCVEQRRGAAGRGPGGRLVIPKLSKAFEFLELLGVNLFLSPWRKEIQSLKVEQRLGGTGSLKSPACCLLGRKPNRVSRGSLPRKRAQKLPTFLHCETHQCLGGGLP